MRKGDRVSIDGFLLEVVKVSSTAHQEPTVMILFINGKSRIASVDEEYYILSEGER